MHCSHKSPGPDLTHTHLSDVALKHHGLKNITPLAFSGTFGETDFHSEGVHSSRILFLEFSGLRAHFFQTPPVLDELGINYVARSLCCGRVGLLDKKLA